MTGNHDFKKPFIDVFRKQKEVLEDAFGFWKQVEEHASESEKIDIASLSPLLESVDDLVYGDLELPSTTFENAAETMNEYIKALNEFSEDQFAAFLMGVGTNWLNLPYWGIRGLKFQCKKIEEWLITWKDLESKASGERQRDYEKRNPFVALPIYDISEKILPSEILTNALPFFKSMLQVLSIRSF
jgi:hypothetical protein